MPKLSKGAPKKIIMVLFSLAAILTIYFLWPVFAPFFIAVLFAYLLRPLINTLIKKNIKPVLAILAIYIAFFGVITLLLWLILPSLAEQSRLLLIYIPDLINELLRRWFDLLNAMERISLPESLLLAIENATDKLRMTITTRITQWALGIPEIIKWFLYALLAPILSYYLLRDKSIAKKKLISLVSAKNRPEFLRLAGDIDHLLRQFICGYLLVSVAVAIITAIFLSIIGVEYPLVLGLLMGIADLVPYFGPIIGAIPAVLVALVHSRQLAVIALIGLLVIQQLEGLVITPLIMGDRIGMHPLITIFVVMTGGYLFGIGGAILAVPGAASLSLLVRYLYSRAVEYQENL